MKHAPVLALVCAMAGSAANQHLMEGKADSLVRVVIYEDLQCSDCAAFRNMMDEKLLPAYQSKVAFEHRDFPLLKHAWARKASIAARCFQQQSPALAIEFRQYVMGHQPEINADNALSTFLRWAKEHHIDEAAFMAGLADAKLAADVESDYQEGVARGIAHTPTVLVNGQPFIETFTFEEVAKAIDSELAANK